MIIIIKNNYTLIVFEAETSSSYSCFLNNKNVHLTHHGPSFLISIFFAHVFFHFAMAQYCMGQYFFLNFFFGVCVHLFICRPRRRRRYERIKCYRILDLLGFIIIILFFSCIWLYIRWAT